jgi:murein DD-endopeptidase MepM/ murein hydrolase activator NlpD
MKRLLKIMAILCLLASLFHPAGAAENGQASIETLGKLDPYTNGRLKALRDDVRKSIYVIKSNRPVEDLPALKFFRYRVKKGDTFWTILSRTSLDMDTLMSVNGLGTPKDVVPGRTIYIPNMRGVIIKGSRKNMIMAILKVNRIAPEYVFKTNRCEDLTKNYLFIPCGRLSNLERSLFLGTGFMHPLMHGRRTSGFGKRRNPFNSRHHEFHTGIDIACRYQSKVMAARDGKVVFTGYQGGYGKLVILKHEHGYFTYYGHLSHFIVKPGQSVKRGTVIALSGNTGRTTGPHLHFEVRKGKRPVNPGILLK